MMTPAPELAQIHHSVATTSRSLRPESAKQSPTDPRSAFSMIGAAILSSPQEGGNPVLGFLVTEVSLNSRI
jgi:hypothetical protein